MIVNKRGEYSAFFAEPNRAEYSVNKTSYRLVRGRASRQYSFVNERMSSLVVMSSDVKSSTTWSWSFERPMVSSTSKIRKLIHSSSFEKLPFSGLERSFNSFSAYPPTYPHTLRQVKIH